jgi:hypothetical protein
MPKEKATHTRFRTYWSLSSTGQRSTCCDCGRRDLRVGYQCRGMDYGHGFCQRVRCWLCAGIKRVEKKTMTDMWTLCLYFAVIENQLCKPCRAENELLGEIKVMVSS